jgi:hypothetical protein
LCFVVVVFDDVFDVAEVLEVVDVFVLAGLSGDFPAG